MLDQNRTDTLEIADQAVTQSEAPTYATLIASLGSRPTNAGPLSATSRNRQSSIRRLMRAIGRVESDSVGDEFRDGLEATLASYQKWEALQGTAVSTSRSRCSHLRTVHRQLKRFMPVGTFAAALDAAITASGLSAAAVARTAGIPPDSLGQWRRGFASPGSHVTRVAQLESVLGIRAGALEALLPRRPSHSSVEEDSTTYRLRLRRRASEPTYALLDASEALRGQWLQLMQYKCGDLPRQRRQRRGRWSTKPARQCKVLSPAWSCTLPNGHVAVSAHVAWAHIRQYLGWLCMDAARGGAGLSNSSVHTLARLVDAPRISDFVRWRAERAGALNEGAVSFLHMVCSLIHPETGWVTQCTALADTATDLVAGPSDWVELCESAFNSLRTFSKMVAASAKPTRDVEEPLRELLDSGTAITMLKDMLVRMEEAMPPTSQPTWRAIHQRDIALVTLLFAIPLRIGQMTALEVGPGTDQNLARLESGWRLQCDASRFKNGRTTMAKGLRLPLDESVTFALDRYVREGRELLLDGQSSHLFFVGRRPWDPTRPCENLEDRLQILTARYIPRCSGFRGHGWRHLLATAWLLEHPEDYATVADLLGDRIETVIAKYRHIERAHAIGRFNAWTKHRSSSTPERTHHGNAD
jgi:site-specific recombinase XerD